MLVLKITHPTPTLVSVQFVHRTRLDDGLGIRTQDTVRGYALPTVGEWHGPAWQAVRHACTVEDAS